LAKIASGRITVTPNVFARDIAQPSVVLEPHPSSHAEHSGAPPDPAGAEPMDEDPLERGVRALPPRGVWILRGRCDGHRASPCQG
jgi:hypothetical protein